MEVGYYLTPQTCGYRLEILKSIGEGLHGKVFLCRDRYNSRLYAVKRMPIFKFLDPRTENRRIKAMKTEKKILRNINHPFIVKMYTSFGSDKNHNFVMEYAAGGTLFDALEKSSVDKGLTEKKARFYGAEIICALKYLHNRGIVHRDLKLDNVLLDKEGHVRIADFGLSRQDAHRKLKMDSLIGTKVYTAPEMFEKDYQGFSIDWWSFGVMMYELLCGQLPFYHKDFKGQKILVTTKEPEYPSHLSPSAKDLLQKLLKKNPTERIGCGRKDAKEVMKHPFFSSVNWKKIEQKRVEVPF